MLLQPNTCFVLNFEAKANKIKNKQVEVKEKDKAKVKVKKPVWLRIIWIWVKTQNATTSPNNKTGIFTVTLILRTFVFFLKEGEADAD